MAIIHLRQDKERPLTIEEVDHNFDALNREVAVKLDASEYTSSVILQLLNGHAGIGSTLDADKLHNMYPTEEGVANTIMSRDDLGNTYVNQIYGIHVGAVLGNVTGNVTGTVTGNSSNVDGVVQIDHGGTGATSADVARLKLGLGSMAVQPAANVTITGGTITGITDITVADGGTGASNASGARSNLGLVIGADVQAYHATLTGLSATTGGGFLVRKTDNTSVVRKFVGGNSIEITNVDAVAGDVTVALTTSPTVSSIVKSGTNGSGDIGQTANRFNVIYGRSTSASYADLAEKYITDQEYEPGTVIVVAEGGGSEATQSFKHDQRVLGVVSTNPAHVMNDESTGQAIGLVGRLPVKIVGPIRKGQAIVSTPDGKAQAGDTLYSFGQALETNLEQGVKLVECVIK